MIKKFLQNVYIHSFYIEELDECYDCENIECQNHRLFEENIVSNGLKIIDEDDVRGFEYNLTDDNGSYKKVSFYTNQNVDLDILKNIKKLFNL